MQRRFAQFYNDILLFFMRRDRWPEDVFYSDCLIETWICCTVTSSCHTSILQFIQLFITVLCSSLREHSGRQRFDELTDSCSSRRFGDVTARQHGGLFEPPHTYLRNATVSKQSFYYLKMRSDSERECLANVSLDLLFPLKNNNQ